ncbi:DUF6397 family protein [Streptomyces antibioticus]|uniref:DUF6397 family protein n=1 Tax=Streptomyces antibioticus TaxID=1890 RepID=UPI003F5F2C02
MNRFRPAPVGHSAPGTPAAHLVEKLTTADDPDEIGWLRSDLARTLDEARAHHPAPRPAMMPRPAETVQPPATDARPDQPGRTDPQYRKARGLLGRLLRRSA